MNINSLINKNQHFFTKSTSQKILTLVLLLFGLIYYFFFQNVNTITAQSTSLRVTPSILELRAVAPTLIRAPLIIENLSDKPTRASIEFKKFKSAGTNDGQIEFTTDGSDFLKNVAIINANTPTTNLRLGPKQKKELILQIMLDENTSISDHYFSTIFTSIQDNIDINQTSQGLHSYSKINLGIGMNVLLSIEKAATNDIADSEPEIIISEFDTPKFINKGPVYFTVKLQNKTSRYIKSKGHIYIENMFGQLIGKITLPHQNILSDSSRYIGSSDQSGLIYVVWPESFVLGPYTARLEIENADNDIQISKTINFLAIPTKLIFTITFSIILLLIIRHRAKKKMSSK